MRSSCPDGEKGLECKRAEARRSVDCPGGIINYFYLINFKLKSSVKIKITVINN